MLIDKFTYYLVHNNDARVADKYIYERIKEKEQESIKRAELAYKNMMRGTLECHCIGFDVSGMKECCKHYKRMTDRAIIPNAHCITIILNIMNRVKRWHAMPCCVVIFGRQARNTKNKKSD